MSEYTQGRVEPGMEKIFFRASAEDFKKIPGGPIAYWVSQKILATFDEPSLGEVIITEGQNKTADNSRFVRLIWEVSRDHIGRDRKWLEYAKGGSFRKWYGNIEHLVDWSPEARAHYRRDPSCRIVDDRFWYLEGITWTDITSGGTSFRYLPSDTTFDMSGPAAFFEHTESIGRYLCLLNSIYVRQLLPIINPTLHAQLRDIKSIPMLRVASEQPELARLARTCIGLAQEDWNSFERSLSFESPPIARSHYLEPLLSKSYARLRSDWYEKTRELHRLEEENNRIFIEAYGLQDELTPDVPLSEITLTCNPHYRYGGDKSEQELEDLLRADTMREFISYAVGCMFGRYSLDKPGLILANQGETLEDYLRLVPQPRFTPDADNVIPLLDGDWFPDDITGRFREFLRVTFGDAHYEENLRFVETALGKKGKPLAIRDFFLKDFYGDHVKRYKKRPIYWLFSSPKGSFNALIYLHRYRPDTASIVLQYLRDFRSKLLSDRDHQEQMSISTSASQGEKTKALKRIEELKKILVELDDYERDTLYPLATRQIPLDLDNGVKVNYLKLGAALKKIPGLDAKDEE